MPPSHSGHRAPIDALDVFTSELLTLLQATIEKLGLDADRLFEDYNRGRNELLRSTTTTPAAIEAAGLTCVGHLDRLEGKRMEMAGLLTQVDPAALAPLVARLPGVIGEDDRLIEGITEEQAKEYITAALDDLRRSTVDLKEHIETEREDTKEAVRSLLRGREAYMKMKKAQEVRDLSEREEAFMTTWMNLLKATGKLEKEELSEQAGDQEE